MRLMSLGSVLLLVAFGAGCTTVQMEGVVRNKETQEPIPGAVVQVDELHTRTDHRGKYELEIDNGDEESVRTVFVSAPGYQAHTEQARIPSTAGFMVRNFEMRPSTPATSQQPGPQQPASPQQPATSQPPGSQQPPTRVNVDVNVDGKSKDRDEDDQD